MVFKDGDRLVLNVTNASIDGYLYVDYIDDDGTVAHMLPNARHADNKLVRAGQEVKVGAAKGEQDPTEPAYEVGAPFGKRMILRHDLARAALRRQAREQVEDGGDLFRGAAQRHRARRATAIPRPRRPCRLSVHHEPQESAKE